MSASAQHYFDAVKNFDVLPDSAIVRVPTIVAILGISRATWWNGISTGKYPPPLAIGARTVGWRVSSIREILASYSEKTERGANATAAITKRVSNQKARREGVQS